MNIVLIGMKHCGKSTVATLLGEWLEASVVDTDDLLADLYTAETGTSRSVREIFREVGYEGFARLERRACREVAGRTEQGEPLVVALGGRTATQEELWPVIRSVGKVAYLKADAVVLYERVMAGGLPPFLDAADPKGSFLTICREREPVYMKLSDVVVDTRMQTPEQVADAVIGLLGLRGD
ncbi:MAG: hypothetical protein GVY16_08155 [Planctomycetes bacterium]|jgi:shikimate kinase|nr:hypothetical protein [Planctomycetota bacterium]